MKNENIIIRIDEDTKKDFQEIINRYGFSMSDVLLTFINDITIKNKLPLNILSKLNRSHFLTNLTIFEIKKMLLNSSLINNKSINKIYLVGDYAKSTIHKKSKIIFILETTIKLNKEEIGYYINELTIMLNKEVNILLSDELNKDELNIYKIEKICLFENN